MVQIKEFFKTIFCFHFYETKDICDKSLHTQMKCSKCGKVKYKFEG